MSNNLAMFGEESKDRKVMEWRRLQLARAKLKLSSKNSALMAGFSMTAFVELEVMFPWQ